MDHILAAIRNVTGFQIKIAALSQERGRSRTIFSVKPTPPPKNTHTKATEEDEKKVPHQLEGGQQLLQHWYESVQISRSQEHAAN